MRQKSKVLGQVYTPEWIVKTILDEIQYNGNSILDKYLLEPSCGDGAFLCEVVRRYIFEAQKANYTLHQIVQNLQTYIYGVEIDKEEYKKCIDNLNRLTSELLSTTIQVQWNIFNTNTLYWYKDYQKFFDFVVGNPPYIRIHNLDTETREYLKANFSFSVGTLDIYISFFELGFQTLKPNGRLGYITPNSYLHNTSYKRFRAFLATEKTLTTLIDFKSNKLFKGFSTYTAISIFDKTNNQYYFEYKELQEDKIKPVNQISFTELQDTKWNFSNKQNSEFIAELFQNKNTALQDLYDIQYGFATLRDKIFIGKITQQDNHYCTFNGFQIEKSILRKIVKGSRYKGDDSQIEWVVFPYEKVQNRFVAIEEQRLKQKYPKAYAYLLFHREELQKRDMDKGAIWYEFGRSQAVQTIHKEKIVVNNLVNGQVIFHKLPQDVFVYSGIFITPKKGFLSWEIMENVLGSEDFYKYIRITGKDFSGGYKSISTKQIKEYKIEYKKTNTLF